MRATFTVNADLLARASLCASVDEDVRLALAGVHVEPAGRGGGVWLVSTDARKMVVIRDHDGKCSSAVTVTVSKAMQRACKARAHEEPRIAALRGGVITISDSAGGAHLMIPNALIDSPYPPWRKVIPEDLKPAIPSAMAWSVEYEIPLAKALSRDCAGLTYYATGGTTDALLVIGSDPIDGFGVLMPMRMSATVPAAYKQLVADKKAAA